MQRRVGLLDLEPSDFLIARFCQGLHRQSTGMVAATSPFARHSAFLTPTAEARLLKIAINEKSKEAEASRLARPDARPER
jgi:hypothetical protein